MGSISASLFERQSPMSTQSMHVLDARDGAGRDCSGFLLFTALAGGDRRVSSPIRFPGSPEGWWGDEALQAEAQAPQAPREQRHQAAGNIPALRSRGLFSAGVPFSTPSHRPVAPAQGRASDSPSPSRSSRSVRAM